MSGWQGLRGGSLLVVIGELLLVVCSSCYLVWWILTFRPSGLTGRGGGPFLAGAVIGGVGGVALLVAGIVALLPRASLPALGVTVAGGVLVGGLLFFLTAVVAHRPVTTELSLIVLWGTAQLAAGVALRTAGVLRPPAAAAWVVAIAVATVVGLACYVVFYRLDPGTAYWIGMVPLAVDGLVALILVVIAVTGRASP